MGNMTECLISLYSLRISASLAQLANPVQPCLATKSDARVPHVFDLCLSVCLSNLGKPALFGNLQHSENATMHARQDFCITIEIQP